MIEKEDIDHIHDIEDGTIRDPKFQFDQEFAPNPSITKQNLFFFFPGLNRIGCLLGWIYERTGVKI